MGIELWISGIDPEAQSLHELVSWLGAQLPQIPFYMKTYHLQQEPKSNYVFIVIPDNLTMALYVIDTLPNLPFGKRRSALKCDFSKAQQSLFKAKKFNPLKDAPLTNGVRLNLFCTQTALKTTVLGVGRVLATGGKERAKPPTKWPQICGDMTKTSSGDQSWDGEA